MPRIRASTIAEHKAQTRTAILDAAEQAFASRDFGAASLGVIADIAGLPRSTVYDYFASREALVAALGAERVPPLVAEFLSMLPDGGPHERLEGFFLATYAMADKHPRLTSALLGAGRRIPREQHDEFVPVAYTLVDTIRSIVTDGVEQGVFCGADPRALTEAVTDLLAGGIHDIVGRERDAIDVDTVSAVRLALLRGGLGVSSARSAGNGA